MSGRKFLPYSRQTIGEEDIRAVVEVLRSDWLTTGPAVERFEQSLADFTGAKYAVAVSSGTAALHAALHAIRLEPGDEVIVPAMTFVATANAVVYCGGVPIFADVRPESLLVDITSVQDRITSKTRGIVAVDYAGQPCDYEELLDIANRHHLFLISDASHALGATYRGSNIGGIAHATTFSFHPVKHITTGEGGMVTTNDANLAIRMRQFRNHGIVSDHRIRSQAGQFYYEMTELGFNYRITDIQCALGQAQLQKLPAWIATRQRLAASYDKQFAGTDELRPLRTLDDRTNAYHLYVVRLKTGRDEAFRLLRQRNIGTNVHYLPVYLHPFYRDRLNYRRGLCPNAETAYQEILSLPLYPLMESEDVEYVASNLKALLRDGQLVQKSADPAS